MLSSAKNNNISPCISNFSAGEVCRDLAIGSNLSRWLFLRGSSEWAAECLFHYSSTNNLELNSSTTSFLDEEKAFFTGDIQYQFLAALMQNNEYLRAHYHAKKCKNEHAVYNFIYYYAKYFDCERRRLESLAEPSPDYLATTASLPSFRALIDSLAEEHSTGQLDENGPLLYLYGMLLSRLRQNEKTCISILVAAVNVQPQLYCAWEELRKAVPPLDQQRSAELLIDLHAQLPRHWMRDVFMAETLLEYHSADEAEVYVQALMEHGFSSVPAVMALRAQLKLLRRDESAALTTLHAVQDLDPYRLDDFDTISHIYFLSGRKEELASLAQTAVTIDKWNEKTLCTVGNYYAIRGQHEKAVVYFKRAVTVNPSYGLLWVLIGHCYIELRNPQMAVKAYSNAIQAAPRDSAGWYGMGQAYEIFKMPSFAIEFYSQAHAINPSDVRFLVALKDVYEKTQRMDEANKASAKIKELSADG